MKKHASGLRIGAYVIAGLVGVYLLGAAALLLDAQFFGTYWFFNNVPEPVGRAVETIYMPIDYLLRDWFGTP